MLLSRLKSLRFEDEVLFICLNPVTSSLPWFRLASPALGSNPLSDHATWWVFVVAFETEIFKLVIESKPQREQMKAAITALSKRIAAVEEHLGRDPSGSRGSCGWSKRACMGGGTAFGSADGRKEVGATKMWLGGDLLVVTSTQK